MTHKTRPIAIAIPMPVALQQTWIGATRRAIAVAFSLYLLYGGTAVAALMR